MPSVTGWVESKQNLDYSFSHLRSSWMVSLLGMAVALGLADPPTDAEAQTLGYRAASRAPPICIRPTEQRLTPRYLV